MLSIMRKHAGSWIIKFLLAAIIVVFIPWGVQRYTSGRSGRVAEVNGSIITLDDYRTTYRNLVDQVRQSFGNNVNDEFIQTLQLPKRALDQLIERGDQKQLEDDSQGNHQNQNHEPDVLRLQPDNRCRGHGEVEHAEARQGRS